MEKHQDCDYSCQTSCQQHRNFSKEKEKNFDQESSATAEETRNFLQASSKEQSVISNRDLRVFQ